MMRKVFFFLLIVIGISYSLFLTKLNKNISIYNSNETMFYLTIENIEISDKKVTVLLNNKEKLLGIYYLDNDNFNYKIGDTVKIIGKLETPSNNTIPNLFNYKKYLNNKKIYWILNIEEIERVKSSHNFFIIIKNKIIDRCNKLQSYKYLKTFIIGNDSSIDAEIRNSYQMNGISHLFCLSGMHVSFITGIIMFILKKMRINNKLVLIIMILILFIYINVVDISPSIIRSIIFFILLSINKTLNLKFNNFEILIITFLTTVFYNSCYIYELGFQYSFIITSFLILNSEKIANTKLPKVLTVSIIAFLASLPINIYNFYNINIFSILINMIFVPLITVIVFPLSFITLIFPIFDSLLYVIICIMEKLSLYLCNIKILNFNFAKPNIVVIFLYYFLIVNILRKKHIYLFIFVLCLIVHNNILLFNNQTYMIMLDVEGESILFVLPHNQGNILIDTGGKIYGNNTTSKIPNYLKSVGIKKINYLILTHGDYDHMGDSISLVNNFKVEKVIFNNDEYNDLELNLIDVLNKKNIKYYKNIKELHIKNNKLYFLNDKLYDNENDNSNVIYLNYNNIKILFMGDAETVVEKDILEKYNLKDIDILKVGHHGSKTSTSQEFIDEINPKYSLISVGKNNIYGHPNSEVLENLEDSIIYRTDINGSIIFKIKNNKLKIETCAP